MFGSKWWISVTSGRAKTQRWLVVPVSAENVNTCLFPKLYWQSPLYHANIPAHTGAILFSRLPALSHTLKFQSRHSSILFRSGFSLAQGFLAHLQSYSGIKSNPIKQQPETQPSSYKRGNGTLWRVFRFTCFRISTSSKRFPLDQIAVFIGN